MSIDKTKITTQDELGEPAPMDALKGLIQERLSWTPYTPGHGETIEL